MLLDRHSIYIQPINYPTVPRGEERLRITPSPLHSDADIDHLLSAFDQVWTEVGVSRIGEKNDNDSLVQLCPVAGPLKMDPEDVGVTTCPWVGDRSPESAAAEQIDPRYVEA